jgi:hypothetical protein
MYILKLFGYQYTNCMVIFVSNVIYNKLFIVCEQAMPKKDGAV